MADLSRDPKGQWDISQSLSDFLTISLVVQQALKTLERRLQAAERAPSQRESRVFSAALEYLSQAREGFFLSLRTGAVPERAELAYLLRQVFVDWQWMEELGIDLEEPSEVERVRSQLIAFAMAAIAIGMMPRLPPELATFPPVGPFRRRGYADIPVPRSPAQWLDRIEEVEQITWHVRVEPVVRLEIESLRRTYGFYEASTWLAEEHLRRFGLLPRD
ncbi:MAG: hypothetical protein GXP39_14350 [Chloroflexi bacterium]|nr:hypothetical protein [Chloroflexota bacterium]